MRARVIGIGEPNAGNDGVGWAVVAAARDAIRGRAEVLQLRDPSVLVALLAEAVPTLLVDALVVEGEPTGAWLRVCADELGRCRALSSHGLDVPTALKLAGALHGPACAAVDVLGVVVPVSTTRGPGLDPDVVAGVKPASDAVLAWVEEVLRA